MRPSRPDLVCRAALEAGRVIMDYYRDGFRIERKTDASPVTDADRAADDIIRRHLEETGIPVISEETSVTPYAGRKNWETLWMVDPLDGTKEFIKHTGEFTVNIALITEGVPREGLVFAPAKGWMYRTEEGRLWKEIYRQAPGGEFEKTAGHILSDIPPSDDVCASISHADAHTRAFVERYRAEYPQSRLISIGSSLKFALLAEGRAGIYPRFSPTMEWDTAAGHALLRAVGGEVWDVSTGKPVRYNRENLRNGSFIAAAPHIRQEKAFTWI